MTKPDIRLDCPRCKEIRTFYYLGVQQNLVRGVEFDLYNCRSCESTISVNKRSIDGKVLDNS